MKRSLILAALAGAHLAGCSLPAGAAGGKSRWQLQKVASVGGFRNPECAVVDAATGTVFVSNVDATGIETINDLDAKGFLSRMGPGGEAPVLRWADSDPVHILNAPKGLAVLGGYVYLNDITELKRRRIDPPGPVEVVATFDPDTSLNDAATDGRFLYVSDTAGGRIFRVDPATGKYMQLKSPPRINGLTFRSGELLGVTVQKGESDIWEIDKFGLLPPRRWGLSKHFVGLDAVEVLDDGKLLISDVWGHRIHIVDPATKAVRTLDLQLEWPADLGIDRRRNLVYVPQFFAGEVTVFRLVKTKDR